MNDAGLGREHAVVKPFPEPPRFVADVMLGSVARWLRILGFDARFGPNFDDDALIRTANAEERILLTADRELALRPVVRHPLLVPPAGLQRQLDAVLTSVPLRSWARPLSRCLLCNTLLVILHRDKARDRVPPHVFDTHEAFLSCPTCQRVFWPGTHRDRILQWLAAHVAGDATN